VKVCVLYCADEVSPEGVPTSARAPVELAEYGPRHEYAYHELTKNTAVRELKRLARRDFDVFMNLCDGAWDEARPGIEAVGALERLDLAFTGAGTAFYEPSREAMKRVCRYLDIRCPRGVAVRGGDEAASVLARLRFPLIVKHPLRYPRLRHGDPVRPGDQPELLGVLPSRRTRRSRRGTARHAGRARGVHRDDPR
jgi:hypothetical protein